jgi:hypothetical protein
MHSHRSRRHFEHRRSRSVRGDIIYGHLRHLSIITGRRDSTLKRSVLAEGKFEGPVILRLPRQWALGTAASATFSEPWGTRKFGLIVKLQYYSAVQKVSTKSLRTAGRRLVNQNETNGFQTCGHCLSHKPHCGQTTIFPWTGLNVAKVAWLDCVNPHFPCVQFRGCFSRQRRRLGCRQESKSNSTRTAHSSELPWRPSSTSLFSKSYSTKVHVSALKGKFPEASGKSLEPLGKRGSSPDSAVCWGLLPWSMGVCVTPFLLVLLLSRCFPEHTRFCRISQVRIASLLKL